MGLFGLWVCLTAGNFLYEFAHSADWRSAMSASFFQGVALIAAALLKQDTP